MYEICTDVLLFEFGRSRRLTYPFAEMEVGHSFLVPNSTPAAISAARSGAYSAQKRYNIRTATRLTSEGLRIWRTA